jgi:hypothetical protein
MCPCVSAEYPAEDFSCLPLMYSSLLSEQLVTIPGQAEVYSDLSFITLQMVVGTLALKHHLVAPEAFLPQCVAAVARRGENNTGYTTGTNTGTGEQDPVSIVCAFETFVRQQVFQRPVPATVPATAAAGSGKKVDKGNEEEQVWLESTSYLPPPSLYRLCAPTMDDTGNAKHCNAQ